MNQEITPNGNDITVAEKQGEVLSKELINKMIDERLAEYGLVSKSISGNNYLPSFTSGGDGVTEDRVHELPSMSST